VFDTYGPFTMPTHDVRGIEHLFDEQIKKDPTPDVHRGVGVYIVATENSEGVLIPRYVGRTNKEFGLRIMQHFKAAKFQKLAENGPLMFFFLARAKDGRILKHGEAGGAENTKAINHLELLLIGTCLKLNRDLLNRQQTRFHQNFHVAGYLDNGPSERDFPAAHALSRLLKTNSTRGRTMAVLVDKNTRFIVQGITCREGTFHAKGCADSSRKFSLAAARS